MTAVIRDETLMAAVFRFMPCAASIDFRRIFHEDVDLGPRRSTYRVKGQRGPAGHRLEGERNGTCVT